MKKTSIIKVQDIDIAVITSGENDFICLTDIAKTREGESRAADIIKNWIRSRSTLEFLGTWEQLYNPGFKVVKFDHFKMNGGLPGFVLKLLNYYYYRPMLAAFLPALQPYKYFVYCIQTLCMETKQDSKQESSLFAVIVDKLRYMDEAELKLAYIKLFRKELEEEWKNITSEADFSNVTDKEIQEAHQKERYGNQFN